MEKASLPMYCRHCGGGLMYHNFSDGEYEAPECSVCGRIFSHSNEPVMSEETVDHFKDMIKEQPHLSQDFLKIFFPQLNK